MELRYAIAAGRFQPNEHLIEEALAATYETNRAVIRAALALLAEAQLVTHERNRGARVRALPPDEAREVFEVRAVIEGLIARYAAKRIDSAGVARIAGLVARMRTAVRADDVRAYVRANDEFHRAVAEIAKHGAAAKQQEIMRSQGARYQFRAIVSKGRMRQSLREHEKIFAALRDRDAAAAEALSREHVENVAELLAKIDVRESIA